MRSLKEEICVTCSTSYPSSSSGDISVASNISSGQEGQILNAHSIFDLCYLLEASDDELCISPSPVEDLKYEICLSPKEMAKGFSESRDLKSLGENYQQFALYEDA